MALDYPRFPYSAHPRCHRANHLDEIDLIFDWSHKDTSPGRYFGLFRCEDCSNEWASSWTWLGRGQKCRRCTRRDDWNSVPYTKPHDVQPKLSRQELREKYEREGRPWNEHHRPHREPHYYENCEYCAELCGSTRRQPGRHACEDIRPGDPYRRAYRP